MKKEQKVSLPQAFTKNPIFASKKQTGMRTIQFTNGDIWDIGVQDPFRPDVAPKPALDIRHGKLLAIIFSQFKIDKKVKMKFSVRELARAMYGDNYNNDQRFNIIKLLGDMRDTWLRTIINGVVVPFPLIKYIQASLGGKNKKKGRNQDDLFFLDYIEFHELFVAYMDKHMQSMFDVNLEQLLNIHNRIVGTLYFYIPCRAVKYTKKTSHDMFTITLTKLLTDIGESVPKTKSERKRKFQHFRKDKPLKSIDLVAELNNLVVSDGRNLQCILLETKDKKDYKLCFWVKGDKIKTVPRNSSLYKHFRHGKRKENISDERILDIWYYRLKNLENKDFNFGESSKYLKNENDALKDKGLTMLYCLMGYDWFNKILVLANETNKDWKDTKAIIQRLGLIELAGENAKNYNLDIINADCELNVTEKKVLSKFNSLSNFDKEDLINFVNFDKEIEFNYLFPNDKEKIMVFEFYQEMKKGRTQQLGKKECDSLSKG